MLFIRVNGNREYVGRCAVFTGHCEKVAHNDHIIRIKLNNLLSPFYVSHLFNHVAGKKLLSAAIKTSAGQYTVSQDGLENVRLPIPSKKTQERFENVVESVKISKVQLIRSLSLTNNFFASLSQRAFRGEL